MKKSTKSCGYNCGSSARTLISLDTTTKLLPTTANLVPIAVPLI